MMMSSNQPPRQPPFNQHNPLHQQQHHPQNLNLPYPQNPPHPPNPPNPPNPPHHQQMGEGRARVEGVSVVSRRDLEQFDRLGGFSSGWANNENLYIDYSAKLSFSDEENDGGGVGGVGIDGDGGVEVRDSSGVAGKDEYPSKLLRQSSEDNHQSKSTTGMSWADDEPIRETFVKQELPSDRPNSLGSISEQDRGGGMVRPYHPFKGGNHPSMPPHHPTSPPYHPSNQPPFRHPYPPRQPYFHEVWPF